MFTCGVLHNERSRPHARTTHSKSSTSRVPADATSSAPLIRVQLRLGRCMESCDEAMRVWAISLCVEGDFCFISVVTTVIIITYKVNKEGKREGEQIFLFQCDFNPTSARCFHTKFSASSAVSSLRNSVWFLSASLQLISIKLCNDVINQTTGYQTTGYLPLIPLWP
jgi:hypothetical protein